VWETSKIHPDWTNWLNNTVDAVMTGSEWGVEVYKKSGVSVPVFSVPHGIDMDEYNDIEPYKIKGVDPNAYKFYGIFQFFERKHPLAFLKSYWNAFQNNENVALIMKTYRIGFDTRERQVIRDTLSRVKQAMPMDRYPPVYLILDSLSRQEVLGLHKSGDCLVSLDRGEGFGLVPFEAGACGNPIMLTGWGGSTEYAKPEHSYTINHTLTPVFGMPWSPFYRGDQMWAEPDLEHAIKTFRYIYKNQEEAASKGKILKQYIADNFSWDKVGMRMLEVIKSL
jgi:glycosyltransferase involved in cell wall biosynthesis